MSGTSGITPREVQAQAILEKAESGDLPKIGEYRLRKGKREQLISVADVLVNNAEGDPGDDLPVFGDLAGSWAVIDLDGLNDADADQDGDQA